MRRHIIEGHPEHLEAFPGLIGLTADDNASDDGNGDTLQEAEARAHSAAGTLDKALDKAASKGMDPERVSELVAFLSEDPKIGKTMVDFMKENPLVAAEKSAVVFKRMHPALSKIVANTWASFLPSGGEESSAAMQALRKAETEA